MSNNAQGLSDATYLAILRWWIEPAKLQTFDDWLASPAGQVTIDEWPEEEEPIEKCESGCSEPVTHHDVDGVPLCFACWESLVNETAADAQKGDAP